jgi:hypothetical protein
LAAICFDGREPVCEDAGDPALDPGRILVLGSDFGMFSQPDVLPAAYGRSEDNS